VPAARASLPNVSPPPQKNLAQSGSHAVPAPAETKPAGLAGLEGGKKSAVETLPNNAVEMDWDDDEEATHVLDRDDEKTGQTNKRPSGAMVAAAPQSAPISTRTPAARPSAPPVSSGPMSNRAPVARVSQPPPIPGAPGGASSRPGASTRPASGLSAPPPPPPPPSAGFRSAPPVPMSSQPPGNQQSQNQQMMGALGAPAGSYPPPSQQQPPPQSQNPFQMPVQVHTAPMPMPGQQQQQQSRPPMQSQPPPSLPPIQAPPQVRMVSRMMEETQMVRPTSKTGLYVGIGIAALVAIIGLFVLLPSKAKLAINVTDGKGANVNRVDIFIDGKKECDTSPCIADVAAGAHEVKALAIAGGDPAIKAVTVESRKDSTVELVLGGGASGTGIRVQGNQSGVKLSVDGKEIGTLPQDVGNLTPGDHKIRVAGSERYQPLEKNVTVAQNEMQDLGNITLTVIKGKATITLGTAGAKVYLVSGSDRRDLPTFPISVDIDTSKSWTLLAQKPGFSDYNQPISFADGQAEKTFDVELNPKGGGGGTATAFNPAPAQHSTPSTPKTPKAPANDNSDSSSASASSGGDATLNINSFPASAVVLDGKPLGQTPQLKISVPAGDHTVTFINSDQNLKKTVKVTVSAGDTKPVIAKLKADN
jgi:serine/threonine-protein kinase